MSANRNRLNTLDVNTITNSESSIEAVSIGKGLRGKEYFPKLNDFDYVQLADLSNVLGRKEEVIPFDWDVLPVTVIDMTEGSREEFGNNPHIEVWTTDINEDGDGTEQLFLPTYGILKQKSGGVLTQITLDLDLTFNEQKKGYILLYI